MNKKILIVSQEYPPNIHGGAGIYAYNLVRGIRSIFDVEVLTVDMETKFGKDFPDLGVKLHRMKIKIKLFPFQNIEFGLKANNFVKKNRYDLVHDNSNCVTKGRFINTVHTTSKQEFDYYIRRRDLRWVYTKIGFFLLHLLEKKVFRKSRSIICPSQSVKRCLKKAVVVDNFVDTRLFRQFKVIKKYDILYAGRFVARKNIIGLLKIFDNIKGPKKILFCGEGNFEETIRVWGKGSNHEVEIRAASYLEMPRIYNQSKVVVLNSFYESFPLVIIESLACGTPVITNLNNPLHDRLYEVKLPKEINIAIERVLDDKTLYDRLSQEGKEFANKCGIERYLDRIKEIYQI